VGLRSKSVPAKPSIAILGTRGYPSFYGGFETLVRYLAPYLADNGYDVTVYGRPGSFMQGEGDPRVKVRVTRGANSKSLSTLSFGLTSVLDAIRHKPDIALIMNCANGYFLPLLRLAGIRTIVNVDGIEWEREKWNRLAKAVFYWGAKATARWADDIVVDSRAIGDYWEKNFRRSGTYIPYGGEPREELPVPLGLKHRGYVLMVARFVPENTVNKFFDAVPDIAKDWPVVIVGSSGYGGPLDERAQELADKYPNVQWLGHINDDDLLHSLWRHCGVYFHGHTVGGTNPALVQAMAVGTPIVARDTVFNREVLYDAGTYVSANPLDISEKISGLIEDEGGQGALSARAMERAQSEFAWPQVTSAYKNVIQLANKPTEQTVPPADCHATTAKTVSVIIPTYNRAKTLETAIRSVDCQTVPVSEIIVVDDCSTDSTEVLCTSLLAQIPTLRYVKLNKNQGATFARNYGIELATSQYIAFQDSDDIWEPTLVADLLPYAAKNKVVFGTCSINFLNGRSKLVPLSFVHNPRRSLLTATTFSLQAVIVDRQLLLDYPFDNKLPRFQDWDEWLRLASDKCVSFQHIPELVAQLYHQADSITLSGAQKRRNALVRILCRHFKMWIHHPYPLARLITRILVMKAARDEVPRL